MLVLEQDGLEVWIFPFDPPRRVRCVRGEIEVIIDLDHPAEIEAYSAALPSGKILRFALKVVAENLFFPSRGVG